jgi:uncharacterized membrane protein YGL010W
MEDYHYESTTLLPAMSLYLEEAFVFYLSYHSNEANQLIHIACVWPIVLTGAVR